MKCTKASDSSAGPGSIWLNGRSGENEPARTRLGGTLRGCDGTRSIPIAVLAAYVRFRRRTLSADHFLFNFRLMTAFLRESNELRVLGPLEAPPKSALSS